MLLINQGLTVMPDSVLFSFSYIKKKQKNKPFSPDPIFTTQLHSWPEIVSPLHPLNGKTNVGAARAGFRPSRTLTLFLLAPAADWKRNKFVFGPQLAIWQQEAATEHNPRFPSISTPINKASQVSVMRGPAQKYTGNYNCPILCTTSGRLTVSHDSLEDVGTARTQRLDDL